MTLPAINTDDSEESDVEFVNGELSSPKDVQATPPPQFDNSVELSPTEFSEKVECPGFDSKPKPKQKRNTKTQRKRSATTKGKKRGTARKPKQKKSSNIPDAPQNIQAPLPPEGRMTRSRSAASSTMTEPVAASTTMTEPAISVPDETPDMKLDSEEMSDNEADPAWDPDFEPGFHSISVAHTTPQSENAPSLAKSPANEHSPGNEKMNDPSMEFVWVKVGAEWEEAIVQEKKEGRVLVKWKSTGAVDWVAADSCQTKEQHEKIKEKKNRKSRSFSDRLAEASLGPFLEATLGNNDKTRAIASPVRRNLSQAAFAARKAQSSLQPDQYSIPKKRKSNDENEQQCSPPRGSKQTEPEHIQPQTRCRKQYIETLDEMVPQTTSKKDAVPDELQQIFERFNAKLQEASKKQSMWSVTRAQPLNAESLILKISCRTPSKIVERGGPKPNQEVIPYADIQREYTSKSAFLRDQTRKNRHRRRDQLSAGSDPQYKNHSPEKSSREEKRHRHKKRPLSPSLKHRSFYSNSGHFHNHRAEEMHHYAQGNRSRSPVSEQERRPFNHRKHHPHHSSFREHHKVHPDHSQELGVFHHRRYSEGSNSPNIESNRSTSSFDKHSSSKKGLTRTNIPHERSTEERVVRNTGDERKELEIFTGNTKITEKHQRYEHTHKAPKRHSVDNKQHSQEHIWPELPESSLIVRDYSSDGSSRKQYQVNDSPTYSWSHPISDGNETDWFATGKRSSLSEQHKMKHSGFDDFPPISYHENINSKSEQADPAFVNDTATDLSIKQEKIQEVYLQGALQEAPSLESHNRSSSIVESPTGALFCTGVQTGTTFVTQPENVVPIEVFIGGTEEKQKSSLISGYWDKDCSFPLKSSEYTFNAENIQPVSVPSKDRLNSADMNPVFFDQLHAGASQRFLSGENTMALNQEEPYTTSKNENSSSGCFLEENLTPLEANLNCSGTATSKWCSTEQPCDHLMENWTTSHLVTGPKDESSSVHLSNISKVTAVDQLSVDGKLCLNHDEPVKQDYTTHLFQGVSNTSRHCGKEGCQEIVFVPSEKVVQCRRRRRWQRGWVVVSDLRRCYHHQDTLYSIARLLGSTAAGVEATEHMQRLEGRYAALTTSEACMFWQKEYSGMPDKVFGNQDWRTFFHAWTLAFHSEQENYQDQFRNIEDPNYYPVHDEEEQTRVDAEVILDPHTRAPALLNSCDDRSDREIDAYLSQFMTFQQPQWDEVPVHPCTQGFVEDADEMSDNVPHSNGLICEPEHFTFTIGSSVDCMNSDTTNKMQGNHSEFSQILTEQDKHLKSACEELCQPDNGYFNDHLIETTTSINTDKYVTYMKCQFNDCLNFATHNFPGQGANFCNEHQSPEMVQVTGQRCDARDCDSTPIYGWDFHAPPEYCWKHRLVGMLPTTTHILCSFESCAAFSTHGYSWTGPIACQIHSKEEMLDFNPQNTCEEMECSRSCTHGAPGAKGPTHCGRHRRAGMVNLRQLRCCQESCSQRANFSNKGVLGKTMGYCKEHHPGGDDLQDLFFLPIVNNKLDQVLTCDEGLTYSWQRQSWELVTNPEEGIWHQQSISDQETALEIKRQLLMKNEKPCEDGQDLSSVPDQVISIPGVAWDNSEQKWGAYWVTEFGEEQCIEYSAEENGFIEARLLAESARLNALLEGANFKIRENGLLHPSKGTFWCIDWQEESGDAHIIKHKTFYDCTVYAEKPNSCRHSAAGNSKAACSLLVSDNIVSCPYQLVAFEANVETNKQTDLRTNPTPLQSGIPCIVWVGCESPYGCWKVEHTNNDELQVEKYFSCNIFDIDTAFQMALITKQHWETFEAR